MKNYNDIAGEKADISLIADRIYRTGYDKAYNDRKIEEEFDYDRGIAIKEAYQQGLDDAWECAKKIGAVNQLILEKIGFDFSEMKPEESWNPSWWVINHYSVSQAIAKIKEYEEKQKADEEIKVGDEVMIDERRMIVLGVDSGGWKQLWCTSSGSVYDNITTSEMTKTGRHFDLSNIFDQMRGDKAE